MLTLRKLSRTKPFKPPIISASGSTKSDKKEKDTYESKRKAFLHDEHKRSIGGKLKLDKKETSANKILMGHKIKELEYGFKHPTKFPPARSFLEAVKDINKSEVFKILRKLPKGAVLHGHDMSLAAEDFIIKDLLHRDNVWAKIGEKDKLEELCYSEKPLKGKWKLVKKMREEKKCGTSGKSVDDYFIAGTTLYEADAGLDVNSVWKKFAHLFEIVGPLLCYEPFWKEYYYQSLKEYDEDNISYLEFRTIVPTVVKKDGTKLNDVKVIQLYVDTLKEFKKEHPKFFGNRVIYAPLRLADDTTFAGYLKIARKLVDAFPDFVAGFDLVGQEDLGRTLHDYADELETLKCQMDFFFHAGETNWSGASTDVNLVDAILLGTKRIGHGYAVTKHPKVCEVVKKKKIGIEICPISNQVLGLVKDIRNHPGASLFTNDYPVVISPDDPGMWKAKGASYDWYEAFMGLAAKWQDLRLLKQLAINSIEQTSLGKDKKKDLMEDWKHRWGSFLDEVNSAKC